MFSVLFLSICLFPIVTPQHNVPASFNNVFRKPNKEQKFWGMVGSHPIRKELERDPGVLLGRTEDFDLSKLRQGGFDAIPKDLIQSKSRNPIDRFLREQRVSTNTECNIEVQMVVSRPGRCIKMRDDTSVCKAGDYIAVNHEDCA